jgi:molybdopterin-guanine dinucleotide biosynthesis protein A
VSEKLGAAVLAAGRIDPELAAATGVTAKALVPVGGQPMIDLVLAALDATEAVGETRVVVGAASELLGHLGARAVVAEGPELMDTVTTGLHALGSPERILVVTGDLPLITAEALDHFCSQALQSNASIVYPVISQEHCERAFPGATRTYVRLKDGRFTGGNVAVLSRGFLTEQSDRLTEAFAARKRPLRLCAMLGWGFLARLLTGSLTLAQIIDRAEKLLGVSVCVVDTPYPEIGFDVDKLTHLRSVEQWLAAHPK